MLDGWEKETVFYRRISSYLVATFDSDDARRVFLGPYLGEGPDNLQNIQKKAMEDDDHRDVAHSPAIDSSLCRAGRLQLANDASLMGRVETLPCTPGSHLHCGRRERVERVEGEVVAGVRRVLRSLQSQFSERVA